MTSVNAELTQHIYIYETDSIIMPVLCIVCINSLVARFCLRFLLLCSYILEDQSVEVDDFAMYLLPAALARFSDSVPNIRIGLARLLNKHVLTNGTCILCCFLLRLFVITN